MAKKFIVETSARHIHVTAAPFATLFGADAVLHNKKDLSQPGQFACAEKLVVVGPKDDPAGIKDSENAAAAFGKIRENNSAFISRGDESGTHKAELKIWGDNVPDAETASWYVNAGQGMGACLTMASEEGAYCLTDKATFLSNKESLDLEIVLGQGEDMKNTYSLIECNPEKLADISGLPAGLSNGLKRHSLNG